MNTKMMAFGLSLVLVLGLLSGIGFLSLFIGALERYLGKPKLQFLKSTLGGQGFAFRFMWNEAKEEVKLSLIKIRLYNPFGKLTQIEVSKEFDGKDESFAMDLDMGVPYPKLLQAIEGRDCTVQIELLSTSHELNFQEEMKGSEFLARIAKAKHTLEEIQSKQLVAVEETKNLPQFGVIHRDNIADTVPGKGAQLAIPSNPSFAQFFAGGGAGAGAAAGAAASSAPKENFALKKVWIIDGCIVCNACENIYPEVFEVLAATCIVRPNAPLNDGLKVQEAAEACPVEVIKFEKAS